MKSITIHGLDDEPPDHRQDFEDLFGTWSAVDLETFDRATQDFGRIDPKDWQ